MDPMREDCNGSPQTVHGGDMGNSLMMPMMPPSNQQVPVGPQGYPMMQPNMMLVQTPFPNQYQQQAPNLLAHASAPPRNMANDDDLFDVRSADSMEMMYDKMPVMPPMGLQIKNGVLQPRQSVETLTTSAGEGTTSESV